MRFPKPIVTEEDVSRWMFMLDEAREKKQCIHVGIMHVFMKELGVPVKVTAGDTKIMLKGLAERRKDPKCIFADGLGGLLSIMHSMSIPFKVTENDKKIMLKELTTWRDVGDGERIAWNIYHLRMFGLKPMVTSWDKKAIERKFKQYREWNLSYSNKFRGMRLAGMHFITRATGLKPKATKSDIKHINWFIKNWKTIKHPKINIAGAEANWYLQKLRQM
ncbi:MAG: hypothetical protein FJY77_05125 [Candidatus Altiarchaeales archaeon]|nr:hypothetical protein [Candidatus Altiarchaeales archaeon]